MTHYKLKLTRVRTVLDLTVLAILAFAIYFNTLDNDFVLDDTPYIRDNHILKSLANIPQFFYLPPNALVEDLSSGFLKGRNIRWVTFAVDHSLGGGTPFPFHLSNIFWHLFAGISFYFLLKMWFKKTNLAFLGAALFLSHPIQTAAVSYISGRKDILATCFLFLTFIGVYRYRETKKIIWMIWALLSFFIALFSKEIAVTFLILLFWVDLCIGKGASRGIDFVSTLRRNWKEYAIFFILTLFFLWHTMGDSLYLQLTSGASHTMAKPEDISGPNLSFANLILFYIYKLILPFNLLVDYRDSFNFSFYPPQWGWILSPLLAVTLLYVLIRLRQIWVEGAIGFAIVIVTLLPVSHLVDFHTPVAEHYLYLPCSGFAIMVASLIGRMGMSIGRCVAIIATVIILIYGGSVINRNRDWQNMETLTEDIIKKVPDNLRAGNTLVHILIEKGDYSRALGQALYMLRLSPYSEVNHYNLGIIYEETGDIERSVHHYRYAILLKKTLWSAYLNLGNLLLDNGREREGLEVIKSLISKYGYEPMAYWVLGNYSARKGDWNGALIQYEKVLEIEPGNYAGHLGVGGALWKLGEQGKGEKELVLAITSGLDIDWVGQYEPWSTFFSENEVKKFLARLQKKDKL